jgi:lipopolysaccharide export system permease protein
MKTLYSMLLRIFSPIFLIALLFFVLTLEMVDIFANLLRYLNNEAPLGDILMVAFFYLPKCLTFALPPALLFAVSFTLGNLYAQNELIAILGAGVSFRSLIVPFLLIGIVFSFGYFYFHEEIVIESFVKKNELSRQLLGQKISYSNTNITVRGDENLDVYHADYYNDTAKTLSGLSVIRRNEDGTFAERIEAEWAEYHEEDSSWRLFNVNRYFFPGGEKRGDPLHAPAMEMSFTRELKLSSFSLSPLQFQRVSRNIEELGYREAREWIKSLRKSGREGYFDALTDYYRRFSFAFTPFIVILLSASIGSRFKKNILLMSLLISLIVSVLYYVSDMVLGLFAKQGMISPAAGAWGAVIVFLLCGSFLLKIART